MAGHRIYAAFYDLCARLSDRQLRPLRRFAAGGASGRVLEIGCGTGANLQYYDWPRINAFAAVDPDPHMLGRARKRAEKAGLASPTRSPRHSEGAGTEAQPSTHFQLAPAEALPFPEDSFDTVVCTLVLCTVTDPFRSLAEVRRVLASGGQLRLVEHVRSSGRMTSRLQDLVQPLYGRLAGGCVLGRNTELTLAAAGFAFEAEGRPSFGPGMPGVFGVARPAS
jgi:ubiquinone/menaquinone biosynthesis C-methylase UbiE